VYKIYPKWIKYLNVKLETLKLLQQNIGKVLKEISIGNYFLNKPSVVQE
jgi:hypothetical protein